MQLFEHLPLGWTAVPLGELGELNRGRSRHRPRHDPILYGGAFPFIQTGDVAAANGRITRHHQNYNEEGLKQSRLWPVGTLCITIAANIAETAFLSYPACFPDSIIGFIANPTRCNSKYVYYALQLLKAQIQSLAASSGSVQDNINLEFLQNLLIPLPPLEKQNRIASALGIFDDKIFSNLQIAHTLEEMSQALFKSWFVDFDPVVAKSEGRKPFGMSDDIAALFPDSFEESELGAVPKGWRVESLVSEFSITMGQSPPGTSYNENGEGTLFFQGRGEFGQRYPTPRLFTTALTRLAKAYDTLVTVRAPVGDINQCLNDCCIGRGLAAIRHNQDSKAYTFYRFRNLTAEFESFNGDGTLFGSVTGDGLREIKHVVPPKSVRVAFENIAGTLDEGVRLNHIESETLTKMRDSLITQLLSGDVNLNSANQLCMEPTAA